MIRILLSLAIAAAAFFGPWALNTGGMLEGEATRMLDGEAFADTTVQCFLNLQIAITGECAPMGGLIGKSITATVLLGAFAGVLGIIGLLPLIGRFTSMVTVLAGIVAVATTALVGYTLMTGEASALTDIRWGAYATGGFGLLAIFTGLAGMRGHHD